MRSTSFLALAALVSVACAQEQVPLGSADVHTIDPVFTFDADMIDKFKAMDVVDALRLAGYADEYFVDEERLVKIFGEDTPRWYAATTLTQAHCVDVYMKSLG